MMWEGNGPWEHGASWGAGGWFMGIGMLLAIVAAVVLVVLLVRLLSPQRAVPASQGVSATTAGAYPATPAGYPTAPPAEARAVSALAETPRDIVQRRYAAGEIDREEYLQKLADL